MNLNKTGVPPPERPYLLPDEGWCRLGLTVNKAFSLQNKVFKTWHMAYHGTSLEGVRNVLVAGPTLLKSGILVDYYSALLLY